MLGRACLRAIASERLLRVSEHRRAPRFPQRPSDRVYGTVLRVVAGDEVYRLLNGNFANFDDAVLAIRVSGSLRLRDGRDGDDAKCRALTVVDSKRAEGRVPVEHATRLFEEFSAESVVPGLASGSRAAGQGAPTTAATRHDTRTSG